MAKRYKTGLHEAYDDAYVNRKNASEILRGKTQDWNAHSQFFDKKGLMNALLERIGNVETDDPDFFGKYIMNGETYTATLVVIKRELLDLAKKFKAMQKKRVREGYEPLKNWPKNILEEKLLLEAHEDVTEEEVAKLQKTLDEYVEEKEPELQVLQYGCVQHTKLLDGTVDKIDRQKCDLVDGILLIVDERSPYKGMAVSDYRKMSNQWMIDRQEAQRLRLKEIQTKAKREFKPVPLSLERCKTVSSRELPDFPKWAKNHLKPTKRIRTISSS